MRWFALLCLWIPWSGVALAEELTAHAVREGHWLEVRGALDDHGRFLAQRVDLVHSQRYQVLIGTAEEGGGKDRFRLLGREVQLVDKTSIEKLHRDGIPGTRIKVEGYYRGDALFVAREVQPRGDGRERIVGRVDRAWTTEDAVMLEVMGFTVVVPPQLELRHEDAYADYELSQRRTQPIGGEVRSEDDQFGKGIRITENLLFAGLAEARWSGEDEFDLNRRDPEDRSDSEGSFRGRLVYRPSPGFVGVFELAHRRLWRNDDEDGRIERDATVVGETYGFWMDPFGVNLHVQLGRMDFDEEREWLYDQNLDGVRLYYGWRDLVAEFSVTTTLSDGSPLDENTLNSMLYVSNGDENEHLAAYVIHRDTDLAIPQTRTHYGIRAFGEFLDGHKSWLEIAYMSGKTADVRTSGWGLDIGDTWMFDSGLSLSLGYAFGQGDKQETGRREQFHQTGLQDNNAKFGGVTSFRYYGELVDPELSNLKIVTAGIGYRFNRRISIDLVGHHYAQHRLNHRLADTEIDKRPNGRDRELGWEADLVFGWRTHPSWDLEIIAAYFSPGAAFDDADSAMLGKLQLRYRF